MRGPIVVLAVAVAGCVSAADDRVTMPEGTAWAAVLVSGGTHGSFEQLGPGEPLSIDGTLRGLGTLEIRTFTAAGLGASVDTSGPVFADRLRPAAACEVALPRPAAIARPNDLDGYLFVDPPADLPRVTADWIRDRCVHQSAPASLVASCADRPCFFPAVDVGCGFTLDGSVCGAPSFCGAGSPGEPVSVAPTSSGCTQSPTELGRDVRYTCAASPSPCRVEVRLGPEPGLPVAITAKTRALFTVPAYVPQTRLEVAGAALLRTGLVTDLVVLEDRVVVLHAGGELIRPEACQAMQLELLDLEDLSTLRQVPAPNCLQALAADPAGALLGLAKTATGAVVYRFDRDGRISESLALATGDAGVRRLVRAPVVFADGDVYAGLMSYDADGKATGTDTVLEVAGGLRQLKPLRRAHEEFLFAAAGLGHQLAVLDAAAGYATVFDPLTEENLLKASSGHDGSGTAIYEPSHAAWVLSAYSTYDALLVLQNAATRVYYHDGPHAPLGLFLVPEHPGWVGVALTDLAAPVPELKLGILDLDQMQLLRGAAVLGRGVATQFQADARGRVYTVLPWSGEVMRLSFGG
ncbi:MAG: hypothetical protein U1E65_26200 [Myxococcota bacterium]